MAHGDLPLEADGRALVAVFASPVAGHLLHFGHEAGFRTVLIEPDEARRAAVRGPHPVVASVADGALGPQTDVVFTDHDRTELGALLAAVHVAALRGRGLPEADIARVHRPIGLNIGSKSPAEIAIATLAGLIADRNSRPGGFTFG